jgi:predicted alpha-1,2-mannosidase
MRVRFFAVEFSVLQAVKAGLFSLAVLPGLLMGDEPVAAQTFSPVDFVNSYIGNGQDCGGTMPFTGPPFAMTYWTPQSRENKVSRTSYSYEDKTISGFIGTHQPAVWMGDFGYVTVMPEIDGVKMKREERAMTFSHDEETVSPYYYAVTLHTATGAKIKAEMTATEHCSILRLTYPKNDTAALLVEASRAGIPGMANVNASEREITGYNSDRMDHVLGPLALPNFKGYFVVKINKAPAKSGVYQGLALKEGVDSIEDKNVGAYASFATDEGEVVEVKVGTSFISVEQARANLHAEIPGWDFDKKRDVLKEAWNDKLKIFEISGASDDERKTFYTAVYHSLLYPMSMTEHGRYYSAFDDKVHKGQSYTAYSIWDIFRAEWSMLTLIAPERIDGMITALLQDYQQGGWMPKWPNPSYTNIMIATHADSLVAEAINKGFKGFDRKLAYQAVYHDAMDPPTDDLTHEWRDREPGTPYEARGGLTYAKQIGYVPADKTREATSSTLEDAYDDWCVAQVAQSLGMTNDYKFFINRSQNYKNIFNAATGFMQGRNLDGAWADPKAGWTEGNKWVYTYCVMQDVPGLMKIMGGPDPFNKTLDEHFSGGHNDHSNEPCHHYPYLYDYSGEPSKTQEKAREIENKFYGNRVNGLDGDDDCGQMSAWYVFTAMGLYPLRPASGEYLIGSPMFEQIMMHLPDNKAFVVTAHNNSPTNVYVQSVMLNHQHINKPVITYADIVKGGTLDFVMGPTPSQWGTDWHPEALPYYKGVTEPVRPK